MEKMSSSDMSDFEQENIYDGLQANVEVLEGPMKMIVKNIEMEGKENEFFIRPSTQKALHEIMEEKKRTIQEIQDEGKRVKRELGIDVDLLTIGAQNQYIFEGAKDKVQEAIKTKGGKEYKHGTIRGKKMTFKSNNLIRLSEQVKELENKYLV